MGMMNFDVRVLRKKGPKLLNEEYMYGEVIGEGDAHRDWRARLSCLNGGLRQLLTGEHGKVRIGWHIASRRSVAVKITRKKEV